MKFGIHTTDTAPHITSITPLAALPGGEVEVHGRKLATETYRQPSATIGEQASPVRMSHNSKVLLHVPDGAISGNIQLRRWPHQQRRAIIRRSCDRRRNGSGGQPGGRP